MAKFDPQNAQKYVDQLARKRFEAAVAAGDVAQEQQRLAEQLAETEARYHSAYRAAVEAGWTDAELRRIGLTKPTAAKVRAVPRKKRTDDDTNNNEVAAPIDNSDDHNA